MNVQTTTGRRYSSTEVERISLSHLRVGDLICSRTEVGSDAFTARRVTWRQSGTTPGTAPTGWSGPSVHYTVAGATDRDGNAYELSQPVAVPLYIVRRDLNKGV